MSGLDAINKAPRYYGKDATSYHIESIEARQTLKRLTIL